MKLKQNLYITYSNQRVRDLKTSNHFNPLDKVITLDTFILELFESTHFKVIIDDILGSAIIHKTIQENNIEYFSYLDSDATSLNTIYSFLIKCKRNDVKFDSSLNGKKLEAITSIDKAYQEYKQKNNLVDISDVENIVFDNWNDDFKDKYNEVFIDDFHIEDISFIQSKTQEKILNKLAQFQKVPKDISVTQQTKIIKPSHEVFDTIDEVKTAIKISRKLLEDGVSADDILIVASDIQEYAPFYKLFLGEYEMKGFSSIGTPLNSFFNSDNPQVQIALNTYTSKIESLEMLYNKLGLELSDATRQNIKSSISILDEKIGIEITEPNQLVGLNKKYKHIIFIGTDINHFPPKSNDNFLYSYDDDLEYFYANNYFLSSQTQLNELKRLSDNLYIITASYNGKRELAPSILLDGNYDDTIYLSDIKSVNQLALNNQTSIPNNNTSKYYDSIMSEEKTLYDGNGVEGIKATHLSASQINSYLSCPLRYLYSNKVKLQAPTQKEEGFDVMEQGSLMHLCYELFGRKIKDNHITSTEKDELYELMYQVSIEAYNHKDTREPKYQDPMEENIHHKIFLSTLQASLRDDRNLGLLAKFVDYYIENAKEFNYFKNTEFEKEFALDDELKPYELKDKDDKNYFIKGFIDRFDILQNHINIIDYKSKKMRSNIDKEKMEQIGELKDVQLALYILFASQEYPNKVYNSSLLSFKGEKPYYHFANLVNEEDLKDTEYYSDEYHTKLKQLIFDTRKNIEAGKFGFDNSDEKMCGWCDIKNICHEQILI